MQHLIYAQHSNLNHVAGLGIVVTAEGVETEGQYEALRQRGCDNVQGYWLGRPLSSSDLVMLLEESELRRS